MIERAVGEGKILLVGEAPSRSDWLANRPFQGSSGKELDHMLHEAGIMRTDCHITYVCQGMLPKKRGESDIKRFFLKHTKKYQVPKDEVAAGRQVLLELIEELQPTLIITLGELALWAVTDEVGITKWRGSVLEAPVGLVPLRTNFTPTTFPFPALLSTATLEEFPRTLFFLLIFKLTVNIPISISSLDPLITFLITVQKIIIAAKANSILNFLGKRY